MRRDVKILLSTAGLGAITMWSQPLIDVVMEMDTFRVADVQVQGLRYLSEEDVVTLLGITPQSSVWSDIEAWSDRVMAHPLVEIAQVTRRLPDGLLVEVTERTPIALAPTPTLEPIDAEGYRLPLDPAVHRLDLPVIATSSTPPEGALLVPDDVRRLVSEVRHLMDSDTAFLQRVSSVAWAERGAMLVRWTDPPVDFLLPPQAPPARLREGLGALADAVAKTPDRPPVVIDLRYEDQVVVRRASGEGS
jgi:cell division septal protein FtsQ